MAIRLAVVAFLLLAIPHANATPRRRCVQTCGPRIELECSGLRGRRLRRCRQRIVHDCRQRSPGVCAVPTTSTTTTSTTTMTGDVPTSSTTTTLDTLPLCGNGVIDPGEACDGAALGEGHCLQGGPVTCLPSCGGWDYGACFHCGNGIKEGLEECDGDDIGDAVCPQEATGGSPVCTPGCHLDDTPCVICGDGDLDPGEYCDDGNHDAQDGCSPTCTDECGDGIVEAPEACDDGARVGGDGCSAFCEIEHEFAGGGDEPWDFCALEWGVAADAPAGATVTCQDGAVPCDRGPAGDESCRFLAYFCMNAPLPGPCGPWAGVTHVELGADSLSGPLALDPAERTAVLDAFGHALARWGGAVVSGDDPARDAAPPVAQSVCGQFELEVPAGASKVVAVQVLDAAEPAHADVDAITFTCGG